MDPANTFLTLSPSLTIKAQNGGLFISRGQGAHARRVIDTYEIIYVRAGMLAMREEDREFRVFPGEALILQPGREHEGIGPFPPDLSFFWLHFEHYPIGDSPGAQDPLRLHEQVVQVRDPHRLTELFRRFLDDQSVGESTPTRSSLLVLLMLAELARTATPRTEHGVSAHLAHRAEEIIRTRFHEELSTSAIAHEIRCNPDYLSRVYRQVFGHGVTEGLHRRRIRAAQQALLEGKRCIDEIATNTGFADPGYFRRLFKRHTGMTPGAYRRMYAHWHVNTV